MTTNGMFFDAKNGDRVYDAESFQIWCQRLFTNGVFREQDGSYGLAVSSAGGRNITVSPGVAFISGAIKILTAPITIAVPSFNGTEPYAIRNVVVDFNSDRDARDITIYVDNVGIGGATAPIRNSNRYQLVIAHVYCPPSTERNNVLPEDITDTRTDPDLCGFMTCRVDERDIPEIAVELDTYMTNFGTKEKAKYDAEIKRLDDKIDRSSLAILDQIAAELGNMSQIETNVSVLQAKITKASEDIDTAETQYVTIAERKGTCFISDAISNIKFSAGESDAFNWQNLKKVILIFEKRWYPPNGGDVYMYTSISLHKESKASTHLLVSDYSMLTMPNRYYEVHYNAIYPQLSYSDMGLETQLIKYDIKLSIALDNNMYVVKGSNISTSELYHVAYRPDNGGNPTKPLPDAPTVTNDFTVNNLRVIAVY